MYPPSYSFLEPYLTPSPWHGLSPADLPLPVFIFTVGCSTALFLQVGSWGCRMQWNMKVLLYSSYVD